MIVILDSIDRPIVCSNEGRNRIGGADATQVDFWRDLRTSRLLHPANKGEIGQSIRFKSVGPGSSGKIGGWSSTRFVGFHDLPGGGQKNRERICESELIVRPQKRFQDFWDPLGTRPKEALPDFGVQKMAQRTTPPSGLFRGALLKSETTFVNQLLTLLHKCGLRFFRCASEHYELVRFFF